MIVQTPCALLCCSLIQQLYDRYDVWVQAGKPKNESNPAILFGKASSYLRKGGPRDKYEWVHEWSPMVRLLIMDRTLYVVVRGTASAHEWNNDYRFIQRGLFFRGGKLGDVRIGGVHDGFADSFDSLSGDLERELVNRIAAGTNMVDNIVVTGHSLGAAVATIIYMAVLNRFPVMAHRTVGVVFGSPRVGDPLFQQTFRTLTADDSRFVRYELLHDPVVNVPFENMLLWKFRHVGEARLLDANYGNDRDNHIIASYKRAIIERMAAIATGTARPELYRGKE